MSPITHVEQQAETVSVAVPVALGDRLADPDTAAQIVALLDHLDLINVIVESLDSMAARSDTIIQSVKVAGGQAVDTVQAHRAEAGLTDLDLVASMDAAAQLVGALPGFTPALLRGGASGALDALTSDEMVSVLHMATAGIDNAATGRDVVPVTGLLSLSRAMKDPDVRRALSFALTVAKGMGQALARNERGATGAATATQAATATGNATATQAATGTPPQHAA